jgi:hypothetical protein
VDGEQFDGLFSIRSLANYGHVRHAVQRRGEALADDRMIVSD